MWRTVSPFPFLAPEQFALWVTKVSSCMTSYSDLREFSSVMDVQREKEITGNWEGGDGEEEKKKTSIYLGCLKRWNTG